MDKNFNKAASHTRAYVNALRLCTDNPYGLANLHVVAGLMCATATEIEHFFEYAVTQRWFNYLAKTQIVCLKKEWWYVPTDDVIKDINDQILPLYGIE